MPVLANPKHEAYAQHRAKGLPHELAHKKTGYKPGKRNGDRFRRDGVILARIQEIQSISANKAGITIDRIMKEAALIGFSNLNDYIDTTGSEPVMRLDRTTRDQMAALSEITTETRYERAGPGEEPVRVVKTKIKAWDKLAALEKLGKQLGMWRDKAELEVAVKFEAPSGLDVSKWLAFTLAQGRMTESKQGRTPIIEQGRLSAPLETAEADA